MKDCHPKCYGHPNVLVIIGTEQGNVFGGFTAKGWDLNMKQRDQIADENAFLFLMDRTHEDKHEIFPIKREFQNKALYHFEDNGGWLFCFGVHGSDLCVSQHCRQDNGESYAKACSYAESFEGDTNLLRNLARENNCRESRIKEIEAFQLFD